ncbi:MAG: hypothetical protein SF053_05745 [Bacteroidia bacterium]|jgi:hypothetical protein|nr:hypothetical protein [Bacteroidia bacterium]
MYPQDEIRQAFEAQSLVEVYRDDIAEGHAYTGYIVDASPSLVLVHLLDDEIFVMNGYLILRTDDITEVTPVSPLLEKIADYHQLRPVVPQGIILSSVAAALESVDKQYPIFLVATEYLEDPGEMHIGKLDQVSATEASINEVNAMPAWHGIFTYSLDEITCIGIDTHYLRALEGVMRRENLYI